MLLTLNDVKIPTFDLTGKVAIVTGGTKGLGYGMAVTFAKYGADVVVASRTASDCQRVEEELKTLGHRALGIPTDVSKSDQVDNLISKTVEAMGKIDIMVCNGGTSATCPALKLPEAEWDRVMDVDLKGVFLCARAAARQMVEQGNGGRIINVASAAGLKGSKNVSPYCAAKAGVVNLTRALALEWAKYNITVNSICPSYVLTNINEEALSDPKVRDTILKTIALRRFGTLDEISAAALYLASDYSGFMSGAFLRLDGGGSQ